MSAVVSKSSPSQRIAAARSGWHRRAALAVRFGLAILLVATLAAMARGLRTGARQTFSIQPVGSTSSQPGSNPSQPISGSAGTSPPSGAIPALPSDEQAGPSGSSALGDADTGGPAGPTTAGAPTPPSPGQPDTGTGAATPPTPAAPTTKPAVISQTLAIFSFGTLVGFPLLCNVATSTLGSGIPNPEVAAVAAQISLACTDASTEGVSGSADLNQRLAILAAINPAVDPAIDQLASVVDAAGSGSQLADFFDQAAALIRYFE
jgi:hypothetical protein